MKRLVGRMLLLFVIVFHMLILFGVFASIFLLPVYEKWYVALPLEIFILHLITTRVDCPLTNLENHIRKSLGMKRIGGFVGHYMVKPIKILIYGNKK